MTGWGIVHERASRPHSDAVPARMVRMLGKRSWREVVPSQAHSRQTERQSRWKRAKIGGMSSWPWERYRG